VPERERGSLHTKEKHHHQVVAFDRSRGVNGVLKSPGSGGATPEEKSKIEWMLRRKLRKKMTGSTHPGDHMVVMVVGDSENGDGDSEEGASRATKGASELGDGGAYRDMEAGANPMNIRLLIKHHIFIGRDRSKTTSWLGCFFF